MTRTTNWIARLVKLVLALGVVAIAGTAHAATISLDAIMGVGGWVAILPAGATPNNGYPSPIPISTDSRISAFEGANPGWNSSPSYDASAWSPYSGTWIDGAGTNPFFARAVFNVAGTPTAGSFTLQVDDDSQLWINGTLVIDDEDGGSGGPLTANLLPYLISGQNVIAFLADNSAGGGYGVYAASGSVTYDPVASTPEPASLALAGLGLAAVAVARRRNARA